MARSSGEAFVIELEQLMEYEGQVGRLLAEGHEGYHKDKHGYGWMNL